MGYTLRIEKNGQLLHAKFVTYQEAVRYYNSFARGHVAEIWVKDAEVYKWCKWKLQYTTKNHYRWVEQPKNIVTFVPPRKAKQ